MNLVYILNQKSEVIKMEVTVKATDGRNVLMTPKQAAVIEVLSKARKGGCASVIGYKPSTNWVKQPTHNIQMITNFSYKKLHERRLSALNQVTFLELIPFIAEDPKLSNTPLNELKVIYVDRVNKIKESMELPDDDGEKTAHQEAHTRCYAYVEGIKLHLVTTLVNKIKQPVTKDGKVICDSIMIPYLELKTTVVEQGEYKKVNSGLPVLMGNAIEHFLNSRCMKYKTLSLKEDNFVSFNIDKQVILSEDIKSLQLIEE
jgi:hypothetical protein